MNITMGVWYRVRYRSTIWTGDPSGHLTKVGEKVQTVDLFPMEYDNWGKIVFRWAEGCRPAEKVMNFLSEEAERLYDQHYPIASSKEWDGFVKILPRNILSATELTLA